MPRSLIKIYKELEINCPIKVTPTPPPKEKKEKISHKPVAVPAIPNTMYRKKIPEPAKKKGDLMKVRIGGTASRLPSLNFTTIKHRVTKPKRNYRFC